MPRGGPGKPRNKQDALVRFFSFVRKNDNGCWLWIGSTWRSGYACFWEAGRSWRAHMWAYLTYRGPLPENLQLDHQCNQPACVNPWHLRAVTPRENVLRSKTAPTAMNARKVSCIKGHPFDNDNTYITSDGRRQCRLCQQRRNEEHCVRKLAVTTGG